MGIETRRLSVLVLILEILVVFTTLFGVEVTGAHWDGVKFRGHLVSDEVYIGWCYGCYQFDVKVEEILYDPSDLLSPLEVVTIAIRNPMSLKSGERVECSGIYWMGGPLQCIGFIEVQKPPYDFPDDFLSSPSSYYVKVLTNPTQIIPFLTAAALLSIIILLVYTFTALALVLFYVRRKS